MGQGGQTSKREFLKDVKRKMNILRQENAALNAKIYELEEEKIQLIKIEEERDALS